jgi:hypothetical protein
MATRAKDKTSGVKVTASKAKSDEDADFQTHKPTKIKKAVLKVKIEVDGLLLGGLPGEEQALTHVLEKASAPFTRESWNDEEGHEISLKDLTTMKEMELLVFLEKNPELKNTLREYQRECTRNRFRRRELGRIKFNSPLQKELEEKYINQKILCLDEHIVQGLIREAMNTGSFKTPQGFVRRCYTKPRIIPIQTPCGDFATEESTVTEVRCFPVVTKQGPRDVVAEHEALLNPFIEFALEVFPGLNETKKAASYNLDALADRVLEILKFAEEYGGLGAARRKSGVNYDYGIFDLTAEPHCNGKKS